MAWSQMMEIEDALIKMFDEMNISYNGTILFKLANKIDEMIDSGDLSNPDPEFAENYEI